MEESNVIHYIRSLNEALAVWRSRRRSHCQTISCLLTQQAPLKASQTIHSLHIYAPRYASCRSSELGEAESALPPCIAPRGGTPLPAPENGADSIYNLLGWSLLFARREWFHRQIRPLPLGYHWLTQQHCIWHFFIQISSVDT